MSKLSTYLLGVSLVLVVAACGKKDDPTPTPSFSAKTTLLTTPKWRITAVAATTTFGTQTVTSDGYTGQPACVKDDYIKFNTDLTAVKDEGATKCSTSSPQSRPATWSFNSSETEITTVDPSVPAGSVGNTITAEVLQLTSTALQLRTTTTQTSGGFTIVSTATSTYAAF
jgi:hypothetical protein